MVLLRKFNYIYLAFVVAFLLSSAVAGDKKEIPKKSDVYRHSRGTVCLYRILASLQDDLLKPLKNLERSVELELGLDNVLPYLTTEDGTLFPLIKNCKQPCWFDKMFPARFASHVKWETLSKETKKTILNHLTADQIFFKNRQIYGIQFKKGKHPFSGFQNYVEMMSYNDVGNVRGVELHLRGSERASTLALKVRDVTKEIGLGRTALHVHIPFKIKEVALKAEPILESVRTADFIRRTELFTQMNTIFETNTNLSPVMDGLVSNFNTMKTPMVLYRHINSFYKKAIGSTNRLLLTREKTYVGVAGETFYDQPNIWGLEVRTIHRTLSESTSKVVLDGIEHSGETKYFGYDKDLIKEWLETIKEIKIEDELDVSNMELLKIAEKLYPEYKGSRINISHLTNQEKLLFNNIKNSEPSKLLKLIMHNWKDDPLFFDSNRKIEKIRMARISAMRKIMRGDPMQDIMREFLLDSDIYKSFGDSLGIKMDIIEP